MGYGAKIENLTKRHLFQRQSKPRRGRSFLIGSGLGRFGVVIWGLLAMSGCASVQGPEFQAKEPHVPEIEHGPERAKNGAIYQPDYSQRLFEDVKAREPGDILTIVLTEQTSASKEADTSTGKSNEIGVTPPTVFGRPVTNNGTPILDTSLQSDKEFSGEGAASQSNSLSGDITVVVTRVLPNGNLVVKGEKWITINHGDEFIGISGIVRPEDVGADNAVPSTKVANARITYSGRGALADANQMGWVARFFNSPIWPF